MKLLMNYTLIFSTSLEKLFLPAHMMLPMLHNGFINRKAGGSRLQSLQQPENPTLKLFILKKVIEGLRGPLGLPKEEAHL